MFFSYKLLPLLLLCSCSFIKENKNKIENKSVIIDSNISRFMLDSISLTRNHQLTIAQSDFNEYKKKYKVKVNAREIYYRGDTEYYHDNIAGNFAYSYVNPLNGSLIISIFDINVNCRPLSLLTVEINKDVFLQNYSYSLFSNEIKIAEDINESCHLILDKSKYLVGDTINGIVLYNGTNSQHTEYHRKIKVYFSCVVQTKQSLDDVIISDGKVSE